MSRLGVLMVVLTILVLFYDIYGLGLRPVDSSRYARPTQGWTQSGFASWYGAEEQGQTTASGERFDRNKFTAASRKLPFNTMVRVTNTRNGHSTVVRVNDRGPFGKKRMLDLSEAAAKALDMKNAGVTPVKIEVLEEGPRPLAPESTLP